MNTKMKQIQCCAIFPPLRFVPNSTPGVWGLLDSMSPMPTYGGMLGMISRGEAHTSVAGFIVTAERSLGLDWTVNIDTTR